MARRPGTGRRAIALLSLLVVATLLPGPAAHAAIDRPPNRTPTLSIGDSTVTEGNVGPNGANFTVTLDPAASTSVTVHYATSNGTATAPSDYMSKSGTLTFAPGQQTATVTVDVNGDTTDEPDETFFVDLSDASGA